MTELKKCGECNWPYPDSVGLSPMFISSKGYTAEICGICALEISNRELSVIRKKFHGQIAEGYRLEAIDWRQLHPELRPK